MTEIVTAKFQDGTFIPEGEIHFPAGSRVRLVVQSIEDELTRERFLEEFNEFCDAVSVENIEHLSREQLHDRD